MSRHKVSRRDFLKTTGGGATGTAVALGSPGVAGTAPATGDPAAVVAAIGDTLIPTDPDDPGYRTLEPYNITVEVMKDLSLGEEDLSFFDGQAGKLFPGQTFLDLEENQRARYFDRVFAGEAAEGEDGARLRQLLERVRRRIFRVYYGNYPEHAMPRDADGMPILAPGDVHQITNPNTDTVLTGWDRAGFAGPLSWEEEERRRAILKKIDWKE